MASFRQGRLLPPPPGAAPGATIWIQMNYNLWLAPRLHPQGTPPMWRIAFSHHTPFARPQTSFSILPWRE